MLNCGYACHSQTYSARRVSKATRPPIIPRIRRGTGSTWPIGTMRLGCRTLSDAMVFTLCSEVRRSPRPVSVGAGGLRRLGPTGPDLLVRWYRRPTVSPEVGHAHSAHSHGAVNEALSQNASAHGQ